jgi:hypothetical protein
MSEASKTWFNYTPLSAVGPEITDDGSRVLCSIPVERRDDGLPPLELAIIGDETRLDLIRVGTPNSDGDLSEQEQHQIGNIMDHAISVIRLLYGSNLGRLYLVGKPISLGQFSKEDGSPQLQVNAKELGSPPKFDGQLLKNAIAATAPIRVQLSLLVEALHPVTPLEFKFLCYYKLLELELGKNGYWVGLDQHLHRYEGAFRNLDVSKAKLRNFLHAYRDKCAHIRTGNRDEVGLTGNSKEGAVVTKFLPLLHTIVADLLNQRYSDRIKLGGLAELQPVNTPERAVENVK